MITCYARCRFRHGDGCAVVLANKTIEIGGDGSCKTREEPREGEPQATIEDCTHDSCAERARTACHLCHRPVCLSHRWVHPTHGYPLCILCWLSHGPAVFPGEKEEVDDEPA